MKFSDDSSQAASYLRQAVPTMVKYNIVPNPLNYTLWYSYYSEAFPALNQELDNVIERYGTCPVAISESLFIQHISQLDNQTETDLEDFQQAIAQLVNSLSDSLADTAKQSNGFTAALKDNITALEGHDVDASILPVISQLNANATAIYDANQEFHGKLSTAQNEIQLLKLELEKSRHEANTDPLTGLCNRRVLESIYRSFMNENNEENELSLIIMDIDRFKLFNDTHGHLIGDQILKFVGALLKKECPNNIIPVRFGGEEFAMLCPNLNLQAAKDVAENIRIKLSSTLFNHKKTGEKLPPVTASFGLAAKVGSEMLSDIIERADKALYRAKDEGRNQVQVIGAV